MINITINEPANKKPPFDDVYLQIVHKSLLKILAYGTSYCV